MKAILFCSIATLFSSIARISESSCSGTQPRCHAYPKIIGLMKMLSPISLVAMASALKAPKLSAPPVPAPTASAICAAHCSAGLNQLPLVTNAAVGVLCTFSATCVLPGRMRSKVSLLAVTSGSQPKIKSASAMLTRVVRMSFGASAMMTWLHVAPPFCARPAASCVTMPLPSMCAAMPSNWPMVMMPVPPTPATIMP